MYSKKSSIFKRRLLMHIKRPFNIVLIKFILFSILIIIFAYSFLLKAQPILDEIAISQIKSLTITAINSSISHQINENYDMYSDIITIEQDSTGKITALKTNIAKINLIKTGVTASILSNMSKTENTEIYIPLGNLTSIDFLSGLGPKIKIKLLPTNTVNTNLISSFSPAGINQTRHQIILQTQVDLSVIFPKRIKSAQIINDAVIAETILMGNVPESYTYIDDTRNSLLSKANDYADQNTK